MIEFGRNLYRRVKEGIQGEKRLPDVVYDQNLLNTCKDKSCMEEARCKALTGARGYYKELYSRQKRGERLGMGAFMKMGRFTGYAYTNNCPYIKDVNKVTGQEVVGEADEGDVIELS